MAFPKTHLFPSPDQQISAYHRALGYPARVRILRILEESGPHQVRDLVNMIPLTQGAITEHLRKLRDAGLVHVEVHGLLNFYTVDKSGLLKMVETQRNFFNDLGVIEPVRVMEASELAGNRGK